MLKLFTIILYLFPLQMFAQFNIAYHQSGLPFVAVGYEVKNKWRPELRIGSDNYLSNLGWEAVLNYNFIKKEEYQIYGGIGGRANVYGGWVIPIGINFYPLATKKLGFQIEMAPILTTNSFTQNILRGSWGIRYRFSKD